MSHYTIAYDLKSKEARAKAINDVKFWFGEKREKRIKKDLVTAAKGMRMTEAWRQVVLALSFAGVRGFPARVYAAHIVFSR